MKIFLVLLTSLTFVVCLRIECDWAREFLCGDKCLSNQNTCHCGNDTLAYNYANQYYCCQEPNTSCETKNGNVTCQGEPQKWGEPCYGSCKQTARYGFTTLPCADQKECYLGVGACRGTPQCTE